MSEILLGSHVGMSGKEMFLGSVKEAAEYGANALMVYTGAPQNTRRKEIKDLNLEAGLAYAEKAGIREVVIHAPYIINLGNMEKPEMFDFGVDFLAKEVKRTAVFHSKVLVLHPGSSLSAGVEEAVEQIAKGLNLVLDADDSKVNIALETMAGKGSEVGRTFEELRMIYDKVDRKDRLRVCFDTCHVNDAGYDLVNDYEGVFAQFDRVLGLDQIAVIHVNDSLNPLGAHKAAMPISGRAPSVMRLCTGLFMTSGSQGYRRFWKPLGSAPREKRRRRFLLTSRRSHGCCNKKRKEG